jgi:hypothetical protein
MEFGTRMSLHTLPTRTSYDRGSQAIVNIQPLTQNKPTQILLSASNYKTLMGYIFLPNSRSSPPEADPGTDLANVNALVYSITWMHRLYKSTLVTDKYSLVAALHNFLAIPIQFSVTANIYANYTAKVQFGLTRGFALNDTMITTVRGGKQSSRFVILYWVGVAFIVAGAVIHGAVLAWVLWVVHRWNGRSDVPEETGLVEIDAIRAARRVEVVEDKPHTHALTRPRGVGSCFGGQERSAPAEASDRNEAAGPPGNLAGELLKDYLRENESGQVSAWRMMRDFRKRRVRIREGRGEPRVASRLADE